MGYKCVLSVEGRSRVVYLKQPAVLSHFFPNFSETRRFLTTDVKTYTELPRPRHKSPRHQNSTQKAALITRANKPVGRTARVKEQRTDRREEASPAATTCSSPCTRCPYKGTPHSDPRFLYCDVRWPSTDRCHRPICY